MNLDENQIQLYDYDINEKKNAICLVAGAGAGKTNTIIQKIIKMILLDNCDPKHFFITTFTKAAANELRMRLCKYLDYDIVDEMVIGTFHKIANMYLTKYKINEEIIISSFDESLYLYAELVKNDYYNEQHKYIFIDEYQDINFLQEQIIFNLYNRSECNLIVVIGDDQQNIYTFRKSDIKYMLNFIKKYNGNYIYLTKNYRCPLPVVILSNAVLTHNVNKIDKYFIAVSPVQNKIILMSYKYIIYDMQHNYNIIARKIFKKIKHMISLYNDHNTCVNIVIISRYNNILKFIETFLIINKLYVSHLEYNRNYFNKYNIILSTIHGVKGLEFDHVIFIDYHPSEDDIKEEERRLYYVAITRAKIELTIIYDENCPSIFLNECFKIAKDQFINLPKDMKIMEKNKSNKKKKHKKYDIGLICENLTYDNITDLNNIIDFKQLTQRSNGYIYYNKIHPAIDLSIGDLTNDILQVISNYDNILNTIIKNYITRELCLCGDSIYIFDPIKSLIFENISNIQQLDELNLNIFLNKFKENYGCCFIIDNKTKFISKIKQYTTYCINTFPQTNMIWNNIVNKKKYIDSYNKFLTKNATIEDIINVALLEEITNTSRLSLQYIKLIDSHIEIIANKLLITDKFIEYLKKKHKFVCNDMIVNEIIYLENYSIFINLRINNHIYIYCFNDMPDYIDVIKLISFKCISVITSYLNIYIPSMGTIYEIKNLILNENICNQFIKKIMSF